MPAVECVVKAVDSEVAVATVEMAIKPTKAMVSRSFMTIQTDTEKDDAKSEQPKAICAPRSSRSG